MFVQVQAEGASPTPMRIPPRVRITAVVTTEVLSLDAVRRATLAAQGFASGSEDRRPGTRALLAMIRRLGLLQVDSVNVLARAQYLPMFSRLGPYDRDLLDRQSNRAPRRLFEYWGHEASLIPVEAQPLLRWRMADGHAWSGPRRVAQEQPHLVADVLAAVTASGPLTAAELEQIVVGDHARTQDYQWGWNWSDAKRALEYLFGCGEISTAGRDRTFTRRYDVTERVLPPSVLRAPTPSRSDSIRALVAGSARAMAVATEADLRDYWRLPAADTAQAVRELVEDGVLRRVDVAGWPAAYFHRDAAVPRASRGTGLLAPFDPLIWNRARTERIFGMRYRVEIYTPSDRREFGYYVLPFLHDGRLVARLDLKADRAESRLIMRGGWSQASAAGQAAAHPRSFAPDLLRHLQALAEWLGLGDLEVRERGDLSAALRTAAGERRPDSTAYPKSMWR
jgi:uncharacterized protein YcaQ